MKKKQKDTACPNCGCLLKHECRKVDLTYSKFVRMHEFKPKTALEPILRAKSVATRSKAEKRLTRAPDANKGT